MGVHLPKELKLVPIETLIPYAKNARTHSDEQVEQIAASMREFGFTNPVLLDGERGIIAGHGRVLAAKKVGLKEVPTIELGHLTEAKKRAYILADNKLALNAGWDEQLLAAELKDLEALDYDLDVIGFSDEELEDLLEMEPELVEPQCDEDEIPDARSAKVATGDVFLLGKHRLLCGDSTSVTDIDKLFSGGTAELCFTSPPYADQREYNGGKELSTEHLATFIRTAYSRVKYFAVNLGYSRKDGEVNTYWDDYIKEAKNCGLRLLSWNVWDKGECGSIGNQSAMFGISHEWIFVFGGQPKTLNRTVPNKSAGQKTGASTRQADGSLSERRMYDVADSSQLKTVYFCVPQKARNHDIKHPAMFPVQFPEGYFEAMTDPGDTVFEPFGGSGSSLIAAEKTGRICRVMELDPVYCGVILDRWEKYTGKNAHRADGVPWSEIKAGGLVAAAEI